MTVPDTPVTGHAEEAGAAVRDREGAGEGLGVEITVEATDDGAAVGSRVAAGLGADDEGEDDPQDATSATTVATVARRRTAALRITRRPSTDTQRSGIT
jgi:hypothetical protein